MLEATYLTLTSNIALAAIQEAALNAQIAATKQAVDDETLLVEAGKHFADALPSVSKRDWAAVRSALAQAEQAQPLLRKQLAAQRDLLTALTGHFAGEALPEHFTLAKLSLPKDVPVMLSSQIVRQRPDVRAAEANLHAAGALVGVAIANRLPLFNISGNVGRSGSQLGDLANPAPPFLFWTLAGSVTQTIFDGFTLEQRQRAAEAGWDQVAEQYKSTVVNAFQNVADVLQAIKLDAISVDKAIAAEAAARENLCLTVAALKSKVSSDTRTKDLETINTHFQRWWKSVCTRPREVTVGPLREGDSGPNGIDVLTSEQLYLTTKLSRITAQASRYADVVALYQALGGGWWNRFDVEADRDPSLIDGPRPWQKQ